MATALPPAADWTAVDTTEGEFKIAQTNLRAYLAGLLGTNGEVSTARATLVAAKSGANTDITSLSAPSLGAATATTQAASDDSTKVATTAYVHDVVDAAIAAIPAETAASVGAVALDQGHNNIGSMAVVSHTTTSPVTLSAGSTVTASTLLPSGLSGTWRLFFAVNQPVDGGNYYGTGLAQRIS
jgi:hypothetical protein